ncbi:MAG TPA: TetR/AcrR family transcriptional regulator [Pseudonocardia sp.]|jgi:AcrR family transcriptional regulator
MSSGRTARNPARGERRDALIAVAATLFSRKPYGEIFISDIARAAGVAHGLLFYHFKDKRGLYLAALEKVLDDTIALSTAEGQSADVSTNLKAFVRRHMQHRRDHPRTMLALMRAGGEDPEIEALRERARSAGSDALLEMLGARHRPPPPAVRVAVRGCLGCVDEMTIDWLKHDFDLSLDEMQELAFDAVVAVLSAARHLDPGLAQSVALLRRG